jgi:cell wall-associated NlpC family hydrolase
VSSLRYQPQHARPRTSQALPRVAAGVTATALAAVPLMTMTGGPASAATNSGVSVTHAVDVTRAAGRQAMTSAQLAEHHIRHVAHEEHLREIAHERHLAHLRHIADTGRAPASVQSFDAQPVRVTETSTSSVDSAALAWAHTQTGWAYVWGGSGPASGGYDCSGLVQAAYAQQGIQLPRTTWDMLNSPHLHAVSESQLQPGDLVFAYAGDHVEMYDGTPLVTFGAHSPGHGVSSVGWFSWPSDVQFYAVT